MRNIELPVELVAQLKEEKKRTKIPVKLQLAKLTEWYLTLPEELRVMGSKPLTVEQSRGLAVRYLLEVFKMKIVDESQPKTLNRVGDSLQHLKEVETLQETPNGTIYGQPTRPGTSRR